MQIENKVFIVTGGASGLGAATAEMLIKAGAKVMLVDLNADAVAAQARTLGAQSTVADISQADAAQAAVEATVAAPRHSSRRRSTCGWYRRTSHP